MWYHDDAEIQSSPRTTILSNDDQYSLVIAECNLNDIGRYKLKASNELGSAVSECQLDIKPTKIEKTPTKRRSEIDGNPPIFVTSLTDLKFPVGSDVCLHCEVRSSSPYELKWYKDSQLVRETENITVSI